MTLEKINYALSFFENTPILNVITLILAILGIAFSAYFYFKSKKSKRPIYIVKTNSLVKESINQVDSVQILFANNKIANLSVTKIAFWNDGKDTINNTDIAKNDPIKIQIKPDFEILEAKILYSKNESNDFRITLSKDRKFISINFDYFDFEEGIVLQLFHTGSQSSDITVTGTIKSVKEIKRKEDSLMILPSFIYKVAIHPIPQKIFMQIVGWGIILMGSFMTFYSLLKFSNKEIIVTTSEINSSIIYLFPGIIYIWVGYRFVRRTIPKGFDIFNE